MQWSNCLKNLTLVFCTYSILPTKGITWQTYDQDSVLIFTWYSTKTDLCQVTNLHTPNLGNATPLSSRSPRAEHARLTLAPLPDQTAVFPHANLVCILALTVLSRQYHSEFLPSPNQTAWRRFGKPALANCCEIRVMPFPGCANSAYSAFLAHKFWSSYLLADR